MLDVRRLRLLVELADRGTITAVARAHAYSPSAVSQQLATLEREAGVPLLEPTGRRVRLTAAGERLVARAENLMAEMERAEAELAATAQGSGPLIGTVRVAAFQSAVLSLVPAALTTLASQHPELRVEVTELEPEAALPALIGGIYDLVLAEEYPGHPLGLPSATHRRDLMADELLLAVPTSWPTTRPADLAGQPMALEPPGTAARQWAEATCRAAGVEPDVRYTSSDLQIHLRLVASGHAAALLPALSGVRQIAGVVTHRLPQAPHRTITLMTRRGTEADPRLRGFSKALSEVGSDASYDLDGGGNTCLGP